MVGSDYALLTYCITVKLKDQKNLKILYFHSVIALDFSKVINFVLIIHPAEDKILKRVFVDIREIKGFHSVKR